MGKRVLRRAGLLLALGVLAAVWVTPAEADPYRRDGSRWRRSGRSSHRSCGCAREYECRSVSRFAARGQSWALFRRHLHRMRIEPTHHHPRHIFLPRWRAPATWGWGGGVCVGHDSPTIECPLVLDALVDADPSGELRPLEPAPAERLIRGVERLHRGAYDEARVDFRAAVDHDGADPRPYYGLLLCNTLQRKWPAAVADLRRLHALGTLDVSDRLDLESTFDDPKTFARFRAGLEDLTRWSFHEVAPQIVAAWAALAVGDEASARGHLKAALRFAPKDTVARHLQAGLDGTPTASEPAPQADAPREAPPTEREALPEVHEVPSDHLARTAAGSR